MDPTAKKTALRMIPYGLYVLTAETDEGEVGTATVNWVTQASFEPPLVVVGVKADSGVHGVMKKTGAFGLNVLGKDQTGVAFAFFKPAVKEGNTLSGQTYRRGSTGAPILESVPGFVECKVVEFIERGDHSVVVGEVVNAGISKEPEGRIEDVTLRLHELGEKTYYGG